MLKNLILMMTKKTRIAVFCLSLICVASTLYAQKKNVTELEIYLQGKELINVHNLDSTICVDLKYATTDNFTKTILYDTLFNSIYLQPIAAAKLVKAQKYLKTINPNCSLLVYDAARPLSVQRKMYKVVQGTRYAAYVANPARTGLHNYGIAVDLTLCDNKNKPLDMGTSFDFFGRAAGIDKEKELIQQGILTKEQVQNRELLRKVMIQAGFLAIRGEWWHFNALSLGEAKRHYIVIE